MAVARSSSGGVHAMYFRFFIDDVIFSHKPTLLDVAAQLKRSAHAALGLAINCAQFVVFCLFFLSLSLGDEPVAGQRTHGTTIRAL